MELQHTLEKKGRNLATYDFSTLYTSNPHEALKEKLAQVIKKAFKGKNKEFIRVTSKSARWNRCCRHQPRQFRGECCSASALRSGGGRPRLRDRVALPQLRVHRGRGRAADLEDV